MYVINIKIYIVGLESKLLYPLMSVNCTPMLWSLTRIRA